MAVHADSRDDDSSEPGTDAQRASDLTSRLESLLFVSDGPAPIGRLAEALGVTPRRVELAIQALEDEYAARGLRVHHSGSQVQLATAPHLAAGVEQFLGLQTKIRFSRAALETLAIVAYRQPVTRPEIEAIRGVDSDSVVRTLLSAGLVEELGRAPTVGRPVLLGTTLEFLHHFGLRSIEELPPLEEGGGVDADHE
jgi:segregation and condensation protein B